MQGTGTMVNPYLAFNGKCREAMTFYKEALGGELTMQTFGESPVEVQPEHKDRIMHATLAFGQAVIMASDGMPDHEVVCGNQVSLSLSAPTVEEGERIFLVLSAGGHVSHPWSKTFWGAMFGMFKDKFGIDWMVNVEVIES
jgi:PhnB protein